MKLGNRTIENRVVIAVIVSFLLGALWLVLVRFVTWKSTNVHHHANFALYINGVRDPFESFTFYEEVQSCGSEELNNPKTRVHMHDQKSHVVHVHDYGATWGAFFANIGYTLGDSVLKTDAGVFVDNTDSKQLRFILNGTEVDAIANEYIRSEDVLLIDYGTDQTPVLQERVAAIEKDAHDYNLSNDPSSCSGSKPASFSERLKDAIGIGTSSH